MKTIGVLAIQGSVIEHKHALDQCGVSVREVRLPEELEGIAGLIIPGGESTTISKLMRRFDIFEPLKKKIAEGMPVWGTCAGAILVAKKVVGTNPPPTLEAMDIIADRNAYGTHIDSFITTIDFNGKTCEAVFIRAPKLTKNGDIEILAEHEGKEIALQQGNIIVTSFHPELTKSLEFHEYFVKICTQ